ncbi:glucocorticoid receptor-like (DNA-binding domain) [Piedraia hortae CBS 480.64]|uniref:Glucocorticoid receptor-like (DNA-binding domain) n=1 Tax=Piedraia hortae CBS 480.64 TaxID=1314780 RepID=A0A6A7C3H0_9PEZI|nr:glucocorticoid receptor-like (DNA-binding domain) [Piedraia hortae CBS 480.64]
MTSLEGQELPMPQEQNSQQLPYGASQPQQAGRNLSQQELEAAQHLIDHSLSNHSADTSQIAVTQRPEGGQRCTNCGTTKTPLWRRAPDGKTICNACGLYYKARNQMRPVDMRRGGPAPDRSSATPPTGLQGQVTFVAADPQQAGTCPGGGRCNGTGGNDSCNGCPAYNNRISKTATLRGNGAANAPGPEVVVACHNCRTTITPLWRRDKDGHPICNACGLYYKLHHNDRPVDMKKDDIQRRKRIMQIDQPAQAAPPVPSVPLAPQPSNGHAHPPHHNSTHPVAPIPIPVDFTDFTSSKRKRAADEGEDPAAKAAKKEQLRRELDHMMNLYIAKERELAALDEG